MAEPDAPMPPYTPGQNLEAVLLTLKAASNCAEALAAKPLPSAPSMHQLICLTVAVSCLQRAHKALADFYMPPPPDKVRVQK